MRRVFFVFAVFLGFASSIDTADARGSTSTSCLPGELKATLNQLEARFGRMQVISAHRPGARVRGTGRRSKHADCRAVDFRPAKGQQAAVVAWLRANHSGGLGTYSGHHNHIHIDNGGDHTWHNGSGGRTRLARSHRGARYASHRSGKRNATRHAGVRQAATRGGRFASRHESRRTQVARWRGRSKAARVATTQRERAGRNRHDGVANATPSHSQKLPGYQG